MARGVRAGSAYVDVSARTAGFENDIGRIRNMMSRAFSAQNIGSITRVFAALGRTVGNVATSVVGLAASLQKTRVSFEVLTGSVEKGNKALAQLREFSARTPFQFTEVAESSRVLLAFGSNVSDLGRELQVLGDIAGATGNPILELATLFGKARADNRLLTRELNMFIERGIPLGRIIAQQRGMLDAAGRPDQAAVREMAKNSEITYAMVANAMNAMVSEGGMAFGGIQKQSQTLIGLWSTLRDRIIEIAYAAGERLIPAISEAVRIMTVVAQLAASASIAFIEWVGSLGLAEKAWDAIGETGQNAITGILNFFKAGEMEKAQQIALLTMQLYWAQFSEWVSNTWVTTIGNLVNNVLWFRDAIITSLDSIGVIVRDVGDVIFTTFAGAFDNAWTYIKGVVDTITTYMMGAFDGAFRGIQSMFNSLVIVLVKVSQDMLLALEDLAGIETGGFRKVLDKAVSGTEKLNEQQKRAYANRVAARERGLSGRAASRGQGLAERGAARGAGLSQRRGERASAARDRSRLRDENRGRMVQGVMDHLRGGDAAAARRNAMAQQQSLRDQIAALAAESATAGGGDGAGAKMNVGGAGAGGLGALTSSGASFRSYGAGGAGMTVQLLRKILIESQKQSRAMQGEG